jgi:hypothetical protein
LKIILSVTESENLPSADIRFTRKFVLSSEKYGGEAVLKAGLT